VLLIKKKLALVAFTLFALLRLLSLLSSFFFGIACIGE